MNLHYLCLDDGLDCNAKQATLPIKHVLQHPTRHRLQICREISTLRELSRMFLGKWDFQTEHGAERMARERNRTARKNVWHVRRAARSEGLPELLWCPSTTGGRTLRFDDIEAVFHKHVFSETATASPEGQGAFSKKNVLPRSNRNPATLIGSAGLRYQTSCDIKVVEKDETRNTRSG